MAMVKLAGWGAALLTVTLVSLVPALTRIAVQDGFAPLMLLSLRLMVSVVLLSLHLLLTRTPLFLKKGVMIAAIGVGLVNAGGELALFAALVHLDAAPVTMLLATIPLVVLLLLAWRGEALTRLHWLRLGLGLIGAYILIVIPSGLETSLGVVLVVGAVLLFGLQYALTQWYLAGQPVVPVMFIGVLAATAPVTSMYGWQENIAFPTASGATWAAVALLAVGATYIVRLSFLAAARYLGSAELALLLPSGMFVGVVWAIWLLGEQLTPQQWLGGGLTALSAVVGVYAANIAEQRQPAFQPAEGEM